MTTCDLIAALLLHNVSVIVAGDQLILDGPEGGVLDDADIMRHLAGRKREILAILRRDWIAAAVALVDCEAGDRRDEVIGDFEERAGWLEFCANLDRKVAEEFAYHELTDRIGDADTDATAPSITPPRPNGVRMDTHRSSPVPPLTAGDPAEWRSNHV